MFFPRSFRLRIPKRCKEVCYVDLGESFHMSTSIYVYLFAKIDFDTAENEPCKVCPLSVYRSSRSFCRLGSSLSAYGNLRAGGDGAIEGAVAFGDELSVRSKEANELFVLENEYLVFRVPSKALFTSEHLTVLGSFPNCSFKASRQKGKKKKIIN